MTSGQTHEAAGDYVYDTSTVIPILLAGDSISADSAGVQVNGSTVTISTAGTYSLSGILADGQIIVNTKTKGTVRLILNGVNIHSSTSAPIDILDAEKVIIILADSAENTIADGKTYVYDDPVAEEPNAAIFSKSELTIYGSGSLSVNGNFKDGIVSKDGLIIASGTITVTSADDGIRGKDYLVIKDGVLVVTAQGDGLKSDNAVDAAKGFITITAGEIQINAGGDAINAQSDVNISGGTFTISSGGGSSSRSGDGVSAKGIKGTAAVLIEGGTFTIDSADDTIHSNGSITIDSGTFDLTTADDGLHADGTLTINGGEIRITKSYEGIESAVITINYGSIHIVASDDGINVAAGKDSSGVNTGFNPGARANQGGGPGQDTFSSSSAYYLYINGGYVYVDANGDGIDVNGAILMTGGTVLVNGPTAQNNGAIDYDAGFKMTGGFIAAAGSAGMAMTTGQTSSQYSTMIYLTAVQPAGTLVHIQNSAGENILTFAPSKKFQTIAFSSPDLTNGAAYTVYTGGSSTGSAVDGLYQGGTYTAGVKLSGFTISSMITTVGSGSGMGGARR
jgi:hypothetical protein